MLRLWLLVHSDPFIGQMALVHNQYHGKNLEFSQSAFDHGKYPILKLNQVNCKTPPSSSVLVLFFLSACSWTLITPIELCLGACFFVWAILFLFSCLLAHDFRPCMVLHKTMQHGSPFCFNLLKNLAKLFKFKKIAFLAAERTRSLNLPAQNLLYATGIAERGISSVYE